MTVDGFGFVSLVTTNKDVEKGEWNCCDVGAAMRTQPW
jgi:hypothetical protein